MLKFYEVNSEYIKFLKEKGDKRIPNIDYTKHKKFFCGIIFSINNFNYFVPVSSYRKAHTVFLIKDKDSKTKELKPISSLRFSFMFPCPMEYLNMKDFSKEEEKYANLLRKELKYCNKNIEKIKKIANDTYKLGIKEESRRRYNICDFKKLEDKCIEFMKLKKNIL